MKNIRVRIAPSPTGDPHVGTAYIALFNLIFARRLEGNLSCASKILIRRAAAPSMRQTFLRLFNGVASSGMRVPMWGPYGPYRQSERTEIYKNML